MVGKVTAQIGQLLSVGSTVTSQLLQIIHPPLSLSAPSISDAASKVMVTMRDGIKDNLSQLFQNVGFFFPSEIPKEFRFFFLLSRSRDYFLPSSPLKI
jgi:hypothetical protein